MFFVVGVLLLVSVAFGFFGLFVHGLFWLFVVGVVIFVLNGVLTGYKFLRRKRVTSTE